MASYDAPVPLLPVILPAIAPQQGMFWRTEGALGSPIEVRGERTTADQFLWQYFDMDVRTGAFE